MSNSDHRRRLLALGKTLRNGDALLDVEREFIGQALERIGSGEDANEVLQTKLKPGQKKKDIIDRQRISLILHWVHCAMYPDLSTNKQEMSLAEACELAQSTIVPVAKAVFPGAASIAYDPEYIQRCHSAPEYKHLRSLFRTEIDDDFPYSPQVEDPS